MLSGRWNPIDLAGGIFFVGIALLLLHGGSDAKSELGTYVVALAVASALIAVVITIADRSVAAVGGRSPNRGPRPLDDDDE